MHPRLSVEKPIVNWVLVVCKPVKHGAASVLVFKVIVRYLRADRRVKKLAFLYEQSVKPSQHLKC